MIRRGYFFVMPKSINKNSATLNDILFNFAYYPWIVSWILTITQFKEFFHPYAIIRIWNIVGAFLLIIDICIVQRKLSRKRAFLNLGFFILGLVVTIGNGNASFVFYTVLLIIAGRRVKAYKVIKNTMYIQAAVTVITIISAYIGLLPNESVITSGGGIRRERNYLGCVYVSATSNLCASITLEYLFINAKKKTNILLIAGLVALNYYVYVETGTRMPFYISILTIIAMIVVKTISPKEIKKFPRIIIGSSYIISSVFSIVISIFYSPSIAWMQQINTLFNQRLRYAQLGFINWGVTLFGTSIEWDTTAANYNYIDSSYVNILLSYGAVLFVLIIALFTYSCIKISKTNDIAMCCVLTIWAIRAIVDPQLFNIWFNPFLLYLGYGAKEILCSKKMEEFTHEKSFKFNRPRI